MSSFNLSNLRFFNKEGHSLPLAFSGNIEIVFTDKNSNETVFLGVTDSSLHISDFIKTKSAGRFVESQFDDNNKISAVINIPNQSINARITVYTLEINSNSSEKLYSIDTIDTDEIDNLLSAYILPFPSISFESILQFPLVSTELVETQSLFLGIEYYSVSENTSTQTIVSPNQYFESINSEWADQYDLFFVIDNRKNKEFRIFTINSDEVVWSDRKQFDFTTDNRIDIGFCTDTEGYYEDTLYVCLLDKYDKVDENDLGKVYPIGTFKLKAESVGEDERYRALFSNFGIPDPKTYQPVFKNTDQSEGKTDNILLNENSKKMFLTYPEIFPYIGTYKALLNAVEVLGYDDIFFKEWYKEIASNISQKGYITYEISYGADTNANTINNVPIEQRIKLKKLNWLSMVFKINEEQTDLPVDMYGFPVTKNIDTYNDTDMIVKLISLKNWLEKYIIGLNCRIIDVGGEGIVFERYLFNTYGSIQQQNSYDSVKNLYGYAGLDEEDYSNSVLDSSSHAQIGFQIGDDSQRIKISDLKYTKYIDLCNGYFDSDNIYHSMQPNSVDSNDIILAGGTYQFVDPFDLYYARATHTDDKFTFSSLGVGSIEGAKLRVENNTIKISPYDLYNEDSSIGDYTLFKKLPIIELERANIRSMTKPWNKGLLYKIYPDTNTDDDVSYIFEDTQKFTYTEVREYVTLIPGKWTESEDGSTITIQPFKSDSVIEQNKTNLIISNSDFDENLGAERFYETNYSYGFRYSSKNSLSLPMFSILGYTAEDVSAFSNETEMVLEILDGKLLFRDDDNHRSIYINFYYNDESRDQQIDVNIVYDNVEMDITKYLTAEDTYEDNLFNNKQYDYFVEQYKEANENSIRYDLKHTIGVQAAGEYTIDIAGKDAHNNLYSVRAKGTAETFAPEVELTAYTNNESDELVSDITNLNNEYTEYCIYNQTQRISGIDVSYYNIYKTDSSVSISYPNYSYALETPDTTDYLHLMNIVDTFQASGITKKVSTYPEFTTDVMNSYWISLNRNNITNINQFMDWTKSSYIENLIQNTVFSTDETTEDGIESYAADSQFTVDSFLEAVASTDEISAFDVNVVFYNNVGGFPELQTYGWMIGCYGLPERYFTDAANYTNYNEYRLYLPDMSGNSYVWAKVVEAARQDIRVHIAQKAVDILSQDTSYGVDIENKSKVIGNTVEYLLRICEFVNDSSTWNNFVDEMYNAVQYETAESFDNAEHRYNGYYIVNSSVVSEDYAPEQVYNPYNILRYNFGLYKNPDATNKLKQNLLSLGDTTEFLDEIKEFLSTTENNANVSALDFIDNYMEMFYTDNSLLEYAYETAIEMTKNAEWGTDISQKLEVYYRMLYEKMFAESSLILIAQDYISSGIPSGEQGSRIMVTSDKDSVIESGTKQTLQDVINAAINNYIVTNPSYRTYISQNRYRDSYIIIIYTIYKYITLLYFKYLISQTENILNYPVYSDENIDWDPTTMQFALNYDTIEELDNSSAQLNQYPYSSIISCVAQIQPEAAATYIATIKALYEYHTNTVFSENTAIENYIKKEILQNDKWLTIATQDSSYYAVATESGDYAKTGEYAFDGLMTAGSMTPMVPDVYQYLNNPKYSIFIQPIWQQEVQVGVLTEYVEQYSIQSNVPLDDENEQYIYVQFTDNSYNGMFNIGEIVRLSFYRTINGVSKTFESACSYRVVGYDRYGQILVLKGYINESQFTTMYSYIFAPVEQIAKNEDVQTAIEAAKENQTINTLSIYDSDKNITFDMRLARLNPEDLTELYYTPVYFDESNGVYRQMESAGQLSSEFTIYISYAHHTFVDYVVQSESAIENYDATTDIEVKYNRRSGHIMQFVDDTFVLDIKDFDAVRACNFWDNGETRNDIREPSITDASVYKHEIPIEITQGQNIVLELSLKDIDMNNTNNEYRSYWKVYKSDNLSNNPTYEFTSYNKILYLRGFETGYYDIEAFVYDKYGNTSSKWFKNAIIVK